ncbi:hypothetical protein ES703_84704 [subsurface metagenome]
MAILVTGVSGFLGSALIPLLLDKGYTVYGLYRKPPQAYIPLHLIPLIGDITKPELGLEDVPKVGAVVHCAALLSFSSRDKDRLYQTNYQGTVNLLKWMRRHEITRLFHISTAYLFRHNDYERSKQLAEKAIKRYPEIKTTILRPSIIIGNTQVEGLPPLSGFYLGIRAIDHAKRWFERKTSAPPLRVKIRLRGNPEGRLNLIPVDIVAKSIVDIVEEDREGTFYLTHPNPPSLKSLEKPVSQASGADIKITPDFEPTVVERFVSLLMKELSPYLLGEYNFGSDIDCPPLTEEFLTRTIEAFLNS